MVQSEPLCLPLGVQTQTPTRRHGASDVEWDPAVPSCPGANSISDVSQNQAHHFLKPKTLFKLFVTGLISCMPCYGWMPWPYPPCIYASMSCHAMLASRNAQASYSFESQSWLSQSLGPHSWLTFLPSPSMFLFFFPNLSLCWYGHDIADKWQIPFSIKFHYLLLLLN